MAARNAQERWTAWVASVLMAGVAAAGLAGLMWNGRNLYLLGFGRAAAFGFVAQAGIRRLGRGARMASQLVGAIGLTCTAPAAYSIAAGRVDERALMLWVANWVFAANQIHFVQVSIHAARAGSFAEKFAHARWFFLMQPVLLGALVAGARWSMIPALAIVAFVPALLRGTLWFVRPAVPLDIRGLGWSEMRQGVAFGILLAMAFLVG